MPILIQSFVRALAGGFVLSVGFVLTLPAWALDTPADAMPQAKLAFGDANSAQIMALRARSLVPVAATREAVEAMGDASLAPFQADTLYPTDVHMAMWIKMRLLLAKETSSSALALDFQQNFLDRLELHSQDALGMWGVQLSGDEVAHDDWSVKGLYPRFTLPALAAGEHTLWIKLVHQVPTQPKFELLAFDASQARMQNTFLITGALVSLTVLMILLSAYLSVVNRDVTSAWYTLFVLCILLLVVNFMGLGANLLWPMAGKLLEWSVLTTVLQMLAVALQLQFCRSMFLAIHPWRAVSRWTLAAVLFVLVCIGACLALSVSETDLNDQLPYFLVSIVQVRVGIFLMCNYVGISAIFWIVIRSACKGQKTAQIWMLAYLPLFVVTVVVMLGHLGLSTIQWFPYYAPMYCLAFEVPILLLVLHLHHKDLHAGRVEKTTLARLDPLTGFLAAEQFKPQLAHVWRASEMTGKDIAVAYIRVLQGSGREGAQASQALVRILRTVAGAQDTVACVQDNLYAIVMPGQSLGDALRARLSRLVALGIMACQDGLSQEAYRFKIACGTLHASTLTCQELHSALIAKLDHPNGWNNRAIRYVVRRSSSEPLDSQQMSDLWIHALANSDKN